MPESLLSDMAHIAKYMVLMLNLDGNQVVNNGWLLMGYCLTRLGCLTVTTVIVWFSLGGTCRNPKTKNYKPKNVAMSWNQQAKPGLKYQQNANNICTAITTSFP